MAKPKTDKTICRVCRLKAPQVEIALDRGQPMGICKPCRALYQRNLTHKANIFKNFYDVGSSLTSLNYQALASLAPGTYPLDTTPHVTRAGFLALRPDSVCVILWGEPTLVRPSRYGIATWLADLGLLIGSDPIPVLGPDGASIPLTSIGAGLPMEDIGDKLIMYDVKLQERAYKRLKAELAAAKAKTKAPLARMGKNAKGKRRKDGA